MCQLVLHVDNIIKLISPYDNFENTQIQYLFFVENRLSIVLIITAFMIVILLCNLLVFKTTSHLYKISKCVCFCTYKYVKFVHLVLTHTKKIKKNEHILTNHVYIIDGLIIYIDYRPTQKYVINMVTSTLR